MLKTNYVLLSNNVPPPCPHIPRGEIGKISYQAAHLSHHILYASEFQLINVQREQIGHI